MNSSTLTLTALLLLFTVPASIVTPARAQQAGVAKSSDFGNSVAFRQGRQIYDMNCVVCHQSGGGGTPPDFPALAGNARLADVALIVRLVRQGQGKMLAFPKLTDGEIAALATYVRNAWGNQFGTVAPDRVKAILASLAPSGGPKTSVWSGVYSAAQNKRGEEFHSAACATCHGLRLNGAGQPDMPPSPAIARATFLRKWSGQTVAALFGYIRAKMPPDNPGTLTDQQSIDFDRPHVCDEQHACRKGGAAARSKSAGGDRDRGTTEIAGCARVSARAVATGQRDRAQVAAPCGGTS